jgi:hypothetical protein
MKRYKIAAVIIMLHAFAEIGGFLSMLPIWFMGVDSADFLPFDPPAAYFAVAGLFWGVFRAIGAVGLWRNKMWGFVLSAINCTIALILMLSQYFGEKKITE